MDYKADPCAWHNNSTSPNWENWVYADATGRIIGWVYPFHGTHHAWVKTALREDRELGEFLTHEQAKTAIEYYHSFGGRISDEIPI